MASRRKKHKKKNKQSHQSQNHNSNRNVNVNEHQEHFNTVELDSILERRFVVRRDKEHTSADYVQKVYLVRMQRATKYGVSNNGVYYDNDLSDNLLRTVFDLACDLKVNCPNNDVLYGIEPLGRAFHNGLKSNRALAIDALSAKPTNTGNIPDRSSMEYGPDAMVLDDTLADALISGTGLCITDKVHINDQHTQLTAYFVEFLENTSAEQIKLRHAAAEANGRERERLKMQLREIDMQCKYDRGRWFDAGGLVAQYPVREFIKAYEQRCIEIDTDETGLLFTSTRRQCQSCMLRLHSLWIACTTRQFGCVWADTLGHSLKITDLQAFKAFMLQHMSPEERARRKLKEIEDEKSDDLQHLRGRKLKEYTVAWVKGHLLSFEVHDVRDKEYCILLEHPAFQREQCLVHKIGRFRTLNGDAHADVIRERDGVIVTQEQKQRERLGHGDMELDEQHEVSSDE
jgi:hypothetical protein